MRKVLSIADPEDLRTLRAVSEQVSFPLDQETQDLIRDLKYFVVNNLGLGMSAIQFGIKKSLFVMETSDKKLITIINPKIIDGQRAQINFEGCFSIPGMIANVKRPQSINVIYNDENGQTISSELLGLSAVIFQHEYDHCLGKLMIDPPHFNGWREF